MMAQSSRVSCVELVFVVACIAAPRLCYSQSPLPDSFNPGASSWVNLIAMEPDGRILMVNTPNIERFNDNGSRDATFHPRTNINIYAIAVQSDGSVVIGGPSIIARLNSNGDFDTSFNSAVSNNMYTASPVVFGLAQQTDGKILAGGSFTILGGNECTNIGRLNIDSSPDLSFNPGANGTVSCLAVQPDGGILVGGNFTMLGGQGRTNIGRLYADGSLDDSFNPGANGVVFCMAVQPDGKILVGGQFSLLAEQPRNSIARLNADGAIDPTFNPGTDGYVLSLAIQADGKILVGGYYNTLGGQPRNYFGRLNSDGTLDTVFTSGTDRTGEIDPGVNCVALQPDGKILLGGQFNSLAGQPRDGIGRLNNTDPATESLTFDGSQVTWMRGGTAPEVWCTSFEGSTNGTDWITLGVGARVAGGWQLAGVNYPTNASIRAHGIISGGSSWFIESAIGPPAINIQPAELTNAAGSVAIFSTVLARPLSPNSYQWRKEGVNLDDGANIVGAHGATLTINDVLGADAGGYSLVISNAFGSVTSLVARLTVIDPIIINQPTNQLVHAGQNIELNTGVVGSTPLGYQWFKDGVALPDGITSSLGFTNVQPGDAGSYQLIASNGFGNVTSVVAVVTVRVPGADPLNPGPDSWVYTSALQTDNKILLGGRFFTVDGTAHQCTSRIRSDGTVDETFISGFSDLRGYVYCLAVQSDGKILAGGYATMPDIRDRYFVTRFYPNGTVDPAFNANVGNVVYCLNIQPDGNVLVGGDARLDGTESLIRLKSDGSLDTNFSAGADGSVYTTAIQPDGKILVGGSFDLLGGQPRSFIGRLNADGSLDNNFNPGAGGTVYPYVHCLAVQADGKILVGGEFTTIGGQPRKYLARLNVDGTVDSTFDPSANGWVYSIALQSDGKILVGGGFDSLGGETRKYIGRLNSDGSLDSVFDPSANSWLLSLALERDGKILATGYFSELAGQSRSYVGRLQNTEPAIESLAFDGAQITWLRAGTAPEVGRTSFEGTTNGTDWITLGAGVRVAGGWQLAGVDFPTNGTIRARGFVSGGYLNGSSWIVEKYSGAPLIGTAPILGIKSSGDTVLLNVAGEVWREYTIEFAPALTTTNTWQPLGGILLTNSQQLFADPMSGNPQQRFYRARLRLE